MTSLIKSLLLLTVFLTPLIGAYGSFGYEQAKVFLFIVLTSLSGFVWFFYLIKNPKFEWSGISRTAGIFIVILLITSLMGVNPAQSILGTQPYFQGWILYAYFFLFFLLVRVSKIKLEHWAYVLTGSATIVGLLAIGGWIQINLLGHQLPTYAGRVVSTFGQPNFYAGFILLTLPFFRYLLVSKGEAFRGWIMVGFLISLTAITFSASRVAFLGTAGLILFWLIWELPFRKLIFGGVLIILLALFVISLNSGAGWVEKELILLKATNNPDLPTIGVEKRYYFWPILGTLIMERPIQGYGLENIAPVFSGYFEKNKHALFEENLKVKPYLFGLKDLNLDRSHNYILDLLLFSGILGLLVWLVLVGLLIKKLIQSPVRAENTSLLLGLFTYLIWIQFQNQSIVHLLYFWLLMGIIDKGGDRVQPKGNHWYRDL